MVEPQVRQRRPWGPLVGLGVLVAFALALPLPARAIAVFILGLASIPAVLWTLRRLVEAVPVPPDAPPQSPQERSALRSLRAMAIFDAAISGPVLAGLAIGMDEPFGDNWPIILGGAFLFALAFVFPLPVFWRRVRILREARAQGYLPVGPARVSATGDHHLDTLLGRKARATTALCVVIGAVSVVAWFSPALFELLLKDNDAIRAGQYWRLLTVILVHGGLLHLAMNLSALSSVGSGAELLLGAPRMLIVMLVGAVVASVASVLVTPAPAVGASGGIAALIGALLSFGWRQRELLPRGVRDRLVRGGVTAAVMTAALGIAVPQIDNAAHGGGFVFGLLCGLVFQPSPLLRQALAEARARAAEQQPPPAPPAA